MIPLQEISGIKSYATPSSEVNAQLGNLYTKEYK